MILAIFGLLLAALFLGFSFIALIILLVPAKETNGEH